MVLLHVLNDCRQTFNLSLIVAYVNHGLRPKESEEEADLVQKECERLHLPFEYGAFNAKEFKRVGKFSLQEAARRLRFHFFEQILQKYDAQKIALGHHADDVIETLLLNQFFDGRIETMLPKFVSEDGLNTVIRPLYYVWEDETRAYAKEKKVTIIHCQCPVCEDRGMQRKMVKALLSKLERKHPGIKTSILSAAEHFHGAVHATGVPPLYKEVG